MRCSKLAFVVAHCAEERIPSVEREKDLCVEFPSFFSRFDVEEAELPGVRAALQIAACGDVRVVPWGSRRSGDKGIGRWYWSLNPTLDRSFRGEDVYQGVVFSPNFKLSYDFTPKIAGGLEYYGSVGPVTGFDPVSQQQHQIFPAIDLNIAPQWEINFGLGVGLTGATDHLIAKMILGCRFNF
jgi:hypothetical protein